MAVNVEMPKMGFDMTEGTIVSWAKREGDAVAKGDVLAEIETGKTNIEIEAFEDGVLRRILAGPGETVAVGLPIAIIAGADEVIDLPPSTPAIATANGVDHVDGVGSTTAAAASPYLPTSTNAAVVSTAASDGAPDGRLRASPLARRMAGEHGLALAAIAGSGPNGRITRDDVLAALRQGVAVPAGGAPAKVPAPPHAAAPAGALAPGDHAEALSPIRKTIARRLTESWTAAPHIFVTMAIRMDAALELREQVNAALDASGGGKVSVNDLVVKAAGYALRRHPLLNVQWDDGARIRHDHVNIGVAVALDDGLTTVTVADADARPLSAISADVRDKAARAREGKLTAADFEAPSTFTISNLGMYGVDQFTAIINPPEACILAVGAAVPTPVAQDGAVVVRTVMKVTLSADHRVVDGAAAAEFLVTLRAALENPLAMLI